MTYSIEFTDAAKLDFFDAADWYGAINPQIEQRFTESLNVIFEQIQSNPLNWQIIYDEVRKASPKRFPFNVFYLVEEGIVVVFAILHQKRNPSIWKEQIRN